MLTGILLAGGRSMRMGQNKAFLSFKGHFLFEFPLAVLRTSCSEILISTSDPAFLKTGNICVKDYFPDMGPISGLYSCLRRAQHPFSMVLPCDLPLLDKSVPEILLRNYKKYDITVILNENGLPEPLVGIYSKNIISLLSENIMTGKLKLQDIFSFVNTNYINLKDEDSELPGHLFRNINTSKDYKDLICKYE